LASVLHHDEVRLSTPGQNSPAPFAASAERPDGRSFAPFLTGRGLPLAAAIGDQHSLTSLWFGLFGLKHSVFKHIQFGKLGSERFDTLAKNKSSVIRATAGVHCTPPSAWLMMIEELTPAWANQECCKTRSRMH
jgi:hypothetical protein